MFTDLYNALKEGASVTINVYKKGQELSVSVMPAMQGLDDGAQKHIIPIVVSGTPEEIDREFATIIAKPIESTVGLMSNMKAYEEAEKKAAEDSKAAKAAEEKRDKKYKELINKAKKAEENKKLEDALALYKEAKDYAPKSKDDKLAAKIHRLEVKTSQNSLFGAAPSEEDDEAPGLGDEEEAADDKDENEDEE